MSAVTGLGIQRERERQREGDKRGRPIESCLKEDYRTSHTGRPTSVIKLTEANLERLIVHMLMPCSSYLREITCRFFVVFMHSRKKTGSRIFRGRHIVEHAI